MSAAGASAPAASHEDEATLDAPALQLAGEAAPQGRSWSERLANNLAWNAVSELMARGASLWLAFACARALPVPAFGRFSFALALAQYVWLGGDTIANAGYATREVARVRGEDPAGARRLKGRLFSIRLWAAVALSAAMALVLVLAPMPGDMRGALAGASLFFIAYAAFPDWALRAREDFRGLAFANGAAALALVAGTLLWLPHHPTAGMAAALWSGSFAIAALVSLWRLLPARAFSWSGPAEPIWPHARRSLVFAAGAIGGIGCAQAPMIVVGLLATPMDAGLFGAGYRFLLVVINAFSVLWWPLMPVLVRSRPGERDFREALAAMWSVVLLLGLPALLAFTLWPGELLTLAFGARYAGGAATLRITGIVVPLFAATALLEQTCLALGGEVVRARVNALALAVLVGGSVALLPRHGLPGAAFALIAAYTASMGSYAWTYRHALPWPAFARRARGPLALNLGLAIAWGAARALHAPALPALIVAALAYAGIAFGSGLLPRPGTTRAWSAS